MAEQAVAVTRGARFDFGAVAAIDRLVLESDARAGWLAEHVADGHCWVARKEGEIVGFAIFSPSFFRRWFIDLLIVHPDQRRQGVGTALVRQCEAVCAAPVLFISTAKSNAAMRALLAKLDYEPSGRIENLDEDDPELIFIKRLAP